MTDIHHVNYNFNLNAILTHLVHLLNNNPFTEVEYLNTDNFRLNIRFVT
jgi:hypothetical protein